MEKCRHRWERARLPQAEPVHQHWWPGEDRGQNRPQPRGVSRKRLTAHSHWDTPCPAPCSWRTERDSWKFSQNKEFSVSARLHAFTHFTNFIGRLPGAGSG